MTDTSTATGTAEQAPAAASTAAASAAAATPPAAATAAPSPADVAAQAAAAAAAPAGTEGDAADADLYADPAKARAEIARLRREAGDQRINAKATAASEARAAVLADINRALNPDAADNATPTVEGLTAQLATAATAGTAAAMEAATVRAAWEAGINPTKLGFLQYQLSTDKSLDASAPDFAAKLTSSIAALVAADSSLKLTGSAVASGVESIGGANGSATITPEAFSSMSIMERTALYNTNRAAYDKLTGGAQ